MLTSQDKQLTEKSEELAELRGSLKALTCTIESLKSDLDASKGKNTEFEETIKGQTASLETKQDMIDWLNKQLNEFQGLSSLAKFRQNLNESSNSKAGGGGDAPSWMNIYNSTGTAQDCFPSASRSVNNNTVNTSLPTTTTGAQEVDESLSKSTTAQTRQPNWTKSSKVTMSSLNKNNFPVWRK